MDFKKKSKVNKQLLWVGLGSVIMFFGGLTSAYIVRKAEGNWEEFGVPYWFEYSTGIIILSSLLLFVVRHKIKKDQNISYLLFSTFLEKSFQIVFLNEIQVHYSLIRYRHKIVYRPHPLSVL